MAHSSNSDQQPLRNNFIKLHVLLYLTLVPVCLRRCRALSKGSLDLLTLFEGNITF